jgi:hypothetical protein
MSLDPLLRTLHELGISIEGIETKTQALTRLTDDAYEVKDIGDDGEE